MTRRAFARSCERVELEASLGDVRLSREELNPFPLSNGLAVWPLSFRTGSKRSMSQLDGFCSCSEDGAAGRAARLNADSTALRILSLAWG